MTIIQVEEFKALGEIPPDKWTLILKRIKEVYKAFA